MRTTCLIACLLILAAPALGDVDVVGWRTDGTGVYPQADPPTQWGPDTNVAWKAEMPKWSNSTPVLVGDRVFVNSEPDTLLCVSLKDGSILWQKDNPMDAALTEAEKAEAEAFKAKAADVRKRLGPMDKEYREAYQAYRKDRKNEQLKGRMDELRKQVDTLRAELAPYERYEKSGTQKSNGYSTPTTVSDGKHVWAMFNTGVVSCYDLEGNRKWSRYVDRAPHGWGHSASPVLAGDKLLVHVVHMKALNAATGELEWEADKTAWGWGTPIVTTVGDVQVVVTSKGQVIRVSDGKVLEGNLGGLTYCAPLVSDGIVYMIQGGGRASKLTPDGNGGVKAEQLWRTNPKNDRYYASPVLVDGLIYAINQKGHFSVIDAADGKVVNGGGEGEQLDLGKGTVYPSIASAGKHLYVSSDNGTTLVMTLGRAPKVVATNKVESFRSCPVFDGKRMYLRAYENLYCFSK